MNGEKGDAKEGRTGSQTWQSTTRVEGGRKEGKERV